MILQKSTFTRTVAYPGLFVLIVLSLVCALFPEWTSGMLTTIQSAIYKNLSWSYILLVSFFFIFLMVLAFSKLGNIRLGAADSNLQYIPITYYSDGRTGNDIQYLNKEEIIADVLREYERYLSVVSDDEKAMMFVDKEKYKS
uniref:Uncharacterized protein n=1 Tax=Prevotella sp. GTC17253 TaxID=3236793 RepID=A0AB33IUE7_9BACT